MICLESSKTIKVVNNFRLQKQTNKKGRKEGQFGTLSKQPFTSNESMKEQETSKPLRTTTRKTSNLQKQLPQTLQTLALEFSSNQYAPSKSMRLFLNSSIVYI